MYHLELTRKASLADEHHLKCLRVGSLYLSPTSPLEKEEVFVCYRKDLYSSPYKTHNLFQEIAMLSIKERLPYFLLHMSLLILNPKWPKP